MTLTVADMAASARQDGRVASKRSPRAGQPKRRTFTADYKLAILQQFEQPEDPGECGALLRRDGLYHSHIEYWREARNKGALKAFSDKPAGRPARDGSEPENEKLRKENERRTAEPARTKAALEVAGKAHALLELLSERADQEKKPRK